MGRIAESLRSNLRELAQADARLLREMDRGLPSDGLQELTLKQLRERCRERGLKGTSGLRKADLITRLREGPPVPAATQSSSLAALEARLDRLEALLVRIGEHLGVTQ